MADESADDPLLTEIKPYTVPDAQSTARAERHAAWLKLRASNYLDLIALVPGDTQEGVLAAVMALEQLHRAEMDALTQLWLQTVQRAYSDGVLTRGTRADDDDARVH